MNKFDIDNLKYLFEPKSIAVIGASRDPKAWGHVILKNLIDYGFEGRIYPVNPKTESLLGLKCYPDIRAISEDVDLAIIVVPAKMVPIVMEACVEKGVKVAVIITAGFSETGPEGEKLEKKVLEIARKGGIRIVGPNCMGFFVAKSKLNAAFTAIAPKPGKIAFISQSGAFAGTMMYWATMKDIGFSAAISVGNQADLELSDYLMYLADDETTRVTIAYIEGVKDGRKFMKVLEYYTSKKPLIVMKLGRTSSGARAATSHTAAVAGRDELYDVVFKKYGVIRVYEFDDMFNIALAFANLPLPKGDRVGVISAGGGWCVEASDALESLGLKLPSLPEHVVKEMDKILPPFWNRRNPMDLVATVDPEPFKTAVELLMRDENFDILMLLGYGNFGRISNLPFLIPKEDAIAKEIADLVKKYKKPLVVVNVFGKEFSNVKVFEENGIPVYLSIQKAAKVVKALADYAHYLNSLEEMEQT
ncbi:CoA-binding protein [Thermococcus sp. MV5]|uniref:acetate--CoA ligase family protein n=1 Tax=Thermococcus sp. MV5 TaxID=1638272 RepID=UPI00143AC5DD|nr:CoA-binding protein [Thermococcus sp. MV5]NJE26178.1 CoA-binding protein [Thermococcus sp. MV5]